MLNGLKYLRAEVSLGKYDKPVVSFVFEDPLNVGMDLEIDFVKSDFKKYRDMSFFFRNEIEKLKRKMDKIQLDESRATDEKYADEYSNKEIKEG
jgi:hypothetical protein